MRKSELKNLDVKEVSLVDRAANKKKFFMLKNAGGENGLNEIVKELLETEAMDEGKFKEIIKSMSPEAQEACIGALRLLQGFSDEIPMDVYANLMGLCGEDMEPELIMAACKKAIDGQGGAGEGQKTKASDKPIAKMVLPFGNLPLASREMEWDGVAAEKRVRDAAMKGNGQGKESMDWEMYKKAFLYAGEDSENFTSYKFQIADMVDGELKAVPKGIFAAAGALQGARLGEGEKLTVSEADQTDMKTNLEKYYSKMANEFEDENIVAPWAEKKTEKVKTKKEEGGNMEKVDIFKADGSINWDVVPEEMKESVKKLYDDKESIQKAKTEAEEKIKKAEDEKLTAEYIEKAKSLKNIAQKPEEFGVILKQLSQAAPEEAKKLFDVLKAADTALEKAGLFAEVGTSGGGEPATAWGKIEKQAEVMAAKENISKAEATTKVMEQNPKLYDDYLKEKSGVK